MRRAVLGLAIPITLLIAAGCGSIDPTENNFYVRVLNDTPRRVVLSFCGTENNLCNNGKTYDTGTLKPGQAFPTVQTSIGLANPYLVRTRAGQRLGCLPLLFDYNADGATVRVSELVPCQLSYRARSKPPG